MKKLVIYPGIILYLIMMILSCSKETTFPLLTGT